MAARDLRQDRTSKSSRRMAETGEEDLSTQERVFSAFGSGLLIATGLSRRSVGGILTSALSGYLLYRGLTGRCPVSESLGGKMQEMSRRMSQDAPIFVETSVTIEKPAADLYHFWRRFDNLPRIMSHLKSVEQLSDRRSRWTARGPAGVNVEWDAEIVADDEPRRIAWRSVEGAQVPNTGSVEFREALAGRGTEVRVRLQYHPPGGAAGAALARLFGEEPSQQVEDDLRNFKRKLEGGEIPLARQQPQVRGGS